MTYGAPSNLADVASFSQSGMRQFPDHVHYKCAGFLSDIADDVTYNGKEILEIDVFFGVNDDETRERRNRDNWSYSDENKKKSAVDSGPLLIDIEVYLMVKKESGKSIQTNFYTGEPAEYISTSTYEEILRDHAISAMKSAPEVEF